MTRIEFHGDAMKQLERDPKVAAMLGGLAEQVADDARQTAWPQLRVWSRHGVSRRGAFGQARMTGQGALACEFGTHNRPPRAPLRNALRKKRHL